MLDDIGAGVGDSSEESEEEAGDDAAAVGFSFGAEENHGECGEAGGSEHARREIFSGEQKGEEGDEEYFGAEDGGGEGDVAAAEGDEGEDLSDEKGCTREGGVEEMFPLEGVTSEKEPGLEEEPHAQVDDEGGSPGGARPCGGAFDHEGGEGVAEGGAEGKDGGERRAHVCSWAKKKDRPDGSGRSPRGCSERIRRLLSRRP